LSYASQRDCFNETIFLSNPLGLSPLCSLPCPRDDAKGKEFPIDGADNGAAKT